EQRAGAAARVPLWPITVFFLSLWAFLVTVGSIGFALAHSTGFVVWASAAGGFGFLFVASILGMYRSWFRSGVVPPHILVERLRKKAGVAQATAAVLILAGFSWTGFSWLLIPIATVLTPLAWWWVRGDVRR